MEVSMQGRRFEFLISLFVLGIVAVGATSAIASNSQSAAIVPAPAFTPGYQSSAQTDWVVNGGSLNSDRFSSLDQINTGTVHNLKIAWHVKLPKSALKTGFGVFNEGNALEYGGTVYAVTGTNDVYAIDAATGHVKWAYHPKFPKGFTAGLAASRGLGLGDGKVFLARNDNEIVALDQQTGKIAWQVQAAPWKKGYFSTEAPLYYNGMVIHMQAGGLRDFVVAYNASTGKQLWKWYATPAPGEVGHATWTGSAWARGGSPIWHTPTVDPQLGLIYFGGGNPVPYTGYGRGAALFTATIVALHAQTGKLAWYYQTVHHDIWDYDVPQSPVLFDAVYKGKLRHGLAQASKTGWVYILDRATGKPLIGINEVRVPQLPSVDTYPTQPKPIGQPFEPQCASKTKWTGKALDGKPYKVGCIFSPFGQDQFVAFAPGAAGGADWPPSSYSPDTGLMYICSKDSSNAQEAIPIAAVKPGQTGTKLISSPKAGTNLTKYSLFLGGTGHITAIRMTTNRIRWRKAVPLACYSGTLATPHLVFVGRNDGRLIAYDARNGQTRWTSPQMAAGANAPAITYDVNGKQYVVILAGGNPFIKNKLGNDLYAFALG
jgi:PQQ-dependent dehydrogenase (methanol/ethanol family)